MRRKGIRTESTNKIALKQLLYKFPKLIHLMEYRKAKTTVQMLQRMKELVVFESSRIHPTYNQHKVYTGRFSCSNPNMQNLPRDEAFRSCLKAQDGYLLIRADYSQIELRVIAEISHDQLMLQAFKQGEDLHRETASLILGKRSQDVTVSERDVGKALNFSLLYGMGSQVLAIKCRTSYGVEMDLKQAEQYKNKFFKTYKGLAKWQEEVKAKRHAEYTRTLGGRLIYVADKGFTQRLNIPVQGTAADILKLALGDLVKQLADKDARMVSTVHDEIVVECAENQVEEVKTLMEQVMIEAGSKLLKKVPVEVDISIGPTLARKS